MSADPSALSADYSPPQFAISADSGAQLRAAGTRHRFTDDHALHMHGLRKTTVQADYLPVLVYADGQSL